MGIRALERRLRRQGSKGALKPRTVQRRLNKERIEEPTPPPPAPVRTLTAKQGGKVEPYQDQVVRKFGDRFKASPLNPKGMKKLREAGKEKRKKNRESVKKMLKREHEERKKDWAALKEFAKTGKRSSDYALRRKKGKG